MSFPPKNTKNLSPPTLVCAPLSRNAQSFKYWLQLPKAARPTSYNAMVAQKNQRKFYFPQNQSAGSLAACTPHMNATTDHFDKGRILSLTLCFPSPLAAGSPGCLPLHAPAPLSEPTAGASNGFSIYLQKGWQKRDP